MYLPMFKRDALCGLFFMVFFFFCRRRRVVSVDVVVVVFFKASLQLHDVSGIIVSEFVCVFF